MPEEKGFQGQQLPEDLAQIDGMIPVEVQAFAHLTHIAGLGVTLEVEGNVHAHQVMCILNGSQADTGADAVAQGNIGDGVGLSQHRADHLSDTVLSTLLFTFLTVLQIGNPI